MNIEQLKSDKDLLLKKLTYHNSLIEKLENQITFIEQEIQKVQSSVQEKAVEQQELTEKIELLNNDKTSVKKKIIELNLDLYKIKSSKQENERLERNKEVLNTLKNLHPGVVSLNY